VRINNITDGTTFTIMVAEESGWLLNSGDPVDVRTSRRRGSWLGSAQAGQPGQVPGGWGGANMAYNVKTIRYSVGHRTISSGMSAGGWNGNNLPIHSAHRGGAFVLRCDGGTKFLSDGTDFDVLKWISIR